MQTSQQDAERRFREAVAALNGGRAEEARRQAEALAEAMPGHGAILLLLATACRAEGDGAGEEAALDRLLAAEPRSVRGLIMKGDCRARAGDESGAAGFYRAALLAAEGRDHPPQVQDELRRAEAAVARHKADYAARLEAALAAEGLADGRSTRFRQSLDILAGRAQVYFQEPTGYYFPELPQIQFYDPEAFAWAAAVAAETDAIRAEIEAFLAERSAGFRPYLRSDPNQPRLDDNPLLDSGDWSALFLVENGAVADEVVARFPRTWAAMQRVPLPHIHRAGPTVMFSLLKAGARIAPHTGMFNTRLICHLPLIVPPFCTFRVGNESRDWQPGKLIIFDDTIEHEAWNDSGEDRIVLIFDIWRPELSAQEQREVGALMSFANREGGAGPGP